MAKRIEAMRLIDADALKEDVKKYTSVFAKYDWREICEMLNDAPTVDPVKHGHWYLSPFDGNWTCSKCGDKPYHYDMKNMNYCPNCGAKMDERREDGKTD